MNLGNPGSKPYRLRLGISLGVMMLLVAVTAIVLFAFERVERRKREKIHRAVAVLQQFRPDVDVREFESTLGKTSADGLFQQVEFQNRKDRRKSIGITIPLRDATPAP